MMRLAAFALVGWAITLLADSDAERSTSTDAAPAKAAYSPTVDIGRSGPMAQVGGEGTEGPAGTDTPEPTAAEPPTEDDTGDEQPPDEKKTKDDKERYVKPGWLDDVEDREPRTSLFKRLIHMVETAGQVDPDGKMHQKLSEGQLKKVRNTLLEIDYDMQRLLGGDPTIAERDPKKDPLKSPWLTDEDKRELLQKRTLVRPKPEPSSAKTPGVELTDREERVVHIKDGTAQGHSRAVNTGTRNQHGTVIYRAGRNRGSARGGIRSRVINIPPPRKPIPPPSEPEPAGVSDE